MAVPKNAVAQNIESDVVSMLPKFSIIKFLKKNFGTKFTWNIR